MTYYEVLEIGARASVDDIERAYRRLARKVHPDLAPGDPVKAEARMKLLNEIRDTLTDPLLRAGYDERLRLEAARAERAPPPPAEPTVPRRHPVVMAETPAARPPWVATLGLVAVGLAGVAGVYTFYPRFSKHLPDLFEEPRQAAAANGDAAALLTTPVLGSARQVDTRAPRARARGRGAVHVGSSADDVLRLLGPPDTVQPGRHPGESVMRYGSLHLEIKNGRVTGGDAAAR